MRNLPAFVITIIISTVPLGFPASAQVGEAVGAVGDAVSGAASAAGAAVGDAVSGATSAADAAVDGAAGSSSGTAGAGGTGGVGGAGGVSGPGSTSMSTTAPGQMLFPQLFEGGSGDFNTAARSLGFPNGRALDPSNLALTYNSLTRQERKRVSQRCAVVIKNQGKYSEEVRGICRFVTASR